MANKIKQTQIETPDEVQNRDCFQTPSYATDLLIPFLKKMDVYNIWEPACGKGKIVDRLEYHGFSCVGTDLSSNPSVNFLTEDAYFNYTHIITNPPFSLKAKFYKRCLELGKPFGLLVPADYSGWLIDAIRFDGAEKIIPTRRVDYITPSGLSGATGNTSNFHSFWLTWGFKLGKSENFVELSLESKKNV